MEIQHIHPEMVAGPKAQHGLRVYGHPVIVEDTGLAIDALNGLPGAYIKDFQNRVKVDGILRMMNGATNRRARAIVSIAWADINGEDVFFANGEVEGTIPTELRGTSTFGFDRIFSPLELENGTPNADQLTYGELTLEQKNQISMRRVALKNLFAGNVTKRKMKKLFS